MGDALREEFNRWATSGRAATLEAHHRPLVEQMLPLMQVRPRDRILEIGCGEGWACRLLADIAAEGLVVGLDVSDEMIRNARARSAARSKRRRHPRPLKSSPRAPIGWSCSSPANSTLPSGFRSS